MSRLRALSVVIVAAFALALTLCGPAFAAATPDSVTANAPASASIGQMVDVNAHVESHGKPVKGGTVSLTYATTFVGVGGNVELDSKSTDADGNAVLSYEQRAEANDKMRVEYLGPDGTALASADLSISVQPGGRQLYTSSGGLSIPGLNESAVIGLIALVWSLIIFSAFQLVAIGRRATRGGGASSSDAGRMSSEAGSTWIGIVIAVTAVVIASGLVTVLLRNPHTHANMGEDHATYTRTPIASVSSTYPFTGLGLHGPASAETGDPVVDGERLFFSRDCASCHGLGGRGAVIGPNLIGTVRSADDLMATVRSGPVGMPAFTPEVLTDAQVEKIFQYLQAQRTSGG